MTYKKGRIHLNHSITFWSQFVLIFICFKNIKPPHSCICTLSCFTFFVLSQVATLTSYYSFLQCDDSIDELQGGTSNRASRFHLPSPKRKKFSPLKKYEPANITKRRKPKKWTELEEKTLRTAVSKCVLVLTIHFVIFHCVCLVCFSSLYAITHSSYTDGMWNFSLFSFD